NILYLNFEDERFIELNVSDFNLIYEIFLEENDSNKKNYFFLDEIQNIPGWEKWVNRLYEMHQIKIFITGSNRNLLSSEVASTLTGRNRVITNYPFSFREFLSYKKIKHDHSPIYLTEERARIKNAFQEYLKLGGYPEVIKSNDPTLLEQYFKDFIYRDILPRYTIRKNKAMRELCLFLASNIASVHSYKKLQQLVEAKSINTIKNFLEILEEVYLFFQVDLFDYSIKRQIYNPSKIYTIDTALSQSISFQFSKNLGHIYENIVFLELKRQNKDMYYWKDKEGREVDLVVRSGREIEEMIQVCYQMNNPDTRNRDIKALMKAHQEFKKAKLTIITDDEEDSYRTDNISIKMIPLWKWLLMP
ncbi:MAG: ATP-binding protein, partial [Atribacterota bacterium]